jgi:hypothetical protein
MASGTREGNAFLSWLTQQLGKPYVTGGTGPTGYDCSGLIYAGLKKAGVYSNPPRTSEEQYATFPHVSRAQLRPGDLVFSQWPGDNASPGHVQVYMGGGKVIQAPEPGQKVDLIPLTEDQGHIVGYARIPGVVGSSSLQGQLQQQQGGGADISGLMSEAGTLLHGVAEVLDFAFGFFAPGQGWRIAFGALAAGSGYGAARAYMAGSGSLGGSSFPLAVGLAGVSTLAAFMALRPWPVEGDAPERPGKYVAEILEGQAPPPGPERVHDTEPIEAGLAVFAAAYLASKAAGALSSIVGGVGALLSGLAASGAAEGG